MTPKKPYVMPLPSLVEKSTQLVSGVGATALDANLQAALARVVLQELSPVFIVYLDGNILYANNAYLRLFDLASDDQATIDAHVAELRETVSDLLGQMKEGAGRLTTQRSFPTQSGGAHYRVQYFPVFDGANRLVAIGGAYYDITSQVTAVDRLRVTQESFNDVLRSTSDWVWETDEQGRLTFISDRITDLIGQAPTMLVGKLLVALGANSADAKADETVEAALAHHAPFRGRAFDIVDREGRTRRHQLSGVPFFHLRNGRFSGFRGSGTDMTQQHAAERASHEARARLEAALSELNRKNLDLDMALERAQVAARAKGEFLANMSHELRTPLNAIIGFADIMQRQAFGPDPKRYAEYAGYILKAGHHLLHIINDVLDVSRIESHALKIDVEAVQLDELIQQSLALVTNQAAAKKIRLDAEFDRAQCKVSVDLTRATQVLVNLLANAVKFTPANGAIKVSATRRNDEFAEVAVSDSGPGIKPEYQEAIFEPFYQVHEESYTRPHEGAGLGLPISRQLARLMGGDVQVESEVGKGSRFTVFFRLAGGRRDANLI